MSVLHLLSYTIIDMMRIALNANLIQNAIGEVSTPKSAQLGTNKRKSVRENEMVEHSKQIHNIISNW